MSKHVTLNGRTLELSHLDKLYFPQDGLRKGDIITAGSMQ